VEGHEPGRDEQPLAASNVVSGGALAALRLPLVSGREIEDSDTAGAAPVALVDETLARRYLAGRNPIGARIRLGAPEAGEPWREIVGVVGAMPNPMLTQAPLASVYVPMAQAPVRNLVAFLRTPDLDATLALARREVARLDPALALYEAQTVERAFFEETASDRVITGLFVAFAVVALCLASIGLYGVVSYAVAQRTREFGVRLALGAQSRDLLSMVLGQSARLLAAGLVIGLLAGAGLARAIANMLYGVTATDPLTFGGVAAALGAAALLATLLPALRTLRADPVRALRAE
jgi:hypothetical protein